METYHGYVKTPQDAILLFEACRIGFLSRIQRRLSEKERSSIRSGSVFVWDEREAGMRRWTDGKSWSASRVSGSFLTYRELESKRKSNSRGSNNPHDLSSEDTDSSESYHSAKKSITSATEQCRYKHGGLVKQSFSITTTAHQKLHLICYYTKADVISEKLQIPMNDEKLKGIIIPKGMYPETSNVDGVPQHVHHYAGGATHHHNHHHHHTHSYGGDGSVVERSLSPSPYWQLQQSHHHQFDSNSACSTPSISSSPSTEDDYPNFNNRNIYSPYHNGSSTASLPLYPPPNFIQPSNSDNNSNGFGNGSQPINIPNPSSRFTFPTPQQLPFPASYPPHQSSSSVSNGHQLPPQDIPWEKIRNTEDQRQLEAIYTNLKLF